MKTKSKVIISSFGFILFLAISLPRSISGYVVGDLFNPFCEAQAILDHADPFDGRCTIVSNDRQLTNYPVTTALAVLPFLPFGSAGPTLLWALTNSILVYAILSTGQYWRLIVFLSAPYWIAFEWFQWSPLLLAITYLPGLLPLALVKPHVAIPVFLQNLTRQRLFGCLVFVLISLAVDPTWPLRWFRQALATYNDGYIPLLVFPAGLLLPLVLLRWRDRRAQFLAWMCVTPQRWLYDLVLLWFVPETMTQAMILTLCTWPLYFLLRISALGDLVAFYPVFNVLFAYYPLVTIVAVLPALKHFWAHTKNYFLSKSS